MHSTAVIEYDYQTGKPEAGTVQLLNETTGERVTLPTEPLADAAGVAVTVGDLPAWAGSLASIGSIRISVCEGEHCDREALDMTDAQLSIAGSKLSDDTPPPSV